MSKEGPSVKERILKASLDLFREKGYQSTTIDDIASAAKLTKGGIYYYIDKKEDILSEIHNYFADSFIENIVEAVGSVSDPKDKLAKWIETHCQIMEDYLPFISVFFNEMRNINSEAFAQIREKREYVFTLLDDIIVAGIEKGEFRKELDHKIVTFLMLGMMNWFYQWYIPEGGRLSIKEISEIVEKLVCHGICMKADR